MSKFDQSTVFQMSVADADHGLFDAVSEDFQNTVKSDRGYYKLLARSTIPELLKILNSMADEAIETESLNKGEGL